MTTAIIESDVFSQAARAAQRGCDLGVVQAEDRAIALPPSARPDDLNRALDDEGKLAQEQAAVEQRKQAALALTQRWEDLCRRRDGLAARLTTAREDASRLRVIASETERRLLDYKIGIHNQLPFEDLVVAGADLASQERIIALIEAHLPTMETELAALETECTSFAKAHQIQTN